MKIIYLTFVGVVLSFHVLTNGITRCIKNKTDCKEGTLKNSVAHKEQGKSSMAYK
jgi:hypothetical protein